MKRRCRQERLQLKKLRSASAHASKTFLRCDPVALPALIHSRGTRLIPAFGRKVGNTSMSPRLPSRRVSRCCVRAVPCFDNFLVDHIRGKKFALDLGIQHTYRDSDLADAWRKCGYLALLALPGDVFAVNASRPVDVQPPSEDRLCILLGGLLRDRT